MQDSFDLILLNHKLYLKYRLLQNNDISGQIPASIGKLKKLQTLDVSNNKLSGEIPDSLGNLKNLNYL